MNELRPGYAEAVHTLACSLRPGESLTRHHDNWGLYFNRRQVAPASLPALERGVNAIRYHYDTGGERRVVIEFGCDFSDAPESGR